jgi:transposase
LSQLRRSRDDWRAHVAAWQRSGMTSAEYARQHGLHPKTFRWWRSELRRHDRAPSNTLTLVPVKAVPPAAEPVEVTLPGGLVVRVPEQADPARVAQLVRALVASC